MLKIGHRISISINNRIQQQQLFATRKLEIIIPRYYYQKTFGAPSCLTSFPVINNSRQLHGSSSLQTIVNDEITLSRLNSLKTKESTQEFLNQLTDAQKLILFNTLNLELVKQKYHDELGHYLSKFGRPTSIHQQSIQADQTFCEVSPKWLHKKLDRPEATKNNTELGIPEIIKPIIEDEVKGIPPSRKDIYAVGLQNALPFVGFGFLDNLIMILAGDYIDLTIGTILGISTMAAAALGNTISDVAGIASAWYVEKLAEKVGIYQPKLTAFQLASWQIRWITNLGRALGVTIGCLLGMFPLLFLNTASSKSEHKQKDPADSSSSSTSTSSSQNEK